MHLLQDKIALVTGASRGIGRAIAHAYANEGAAVAFTYRASSEKAKALEDQLLDAGVKAKAYQSDASEHQAASELVDQIVKDFGGLDIVVNNAGVTRDNLLLRMNEAQWDEVMNNNLKSVFNLSKYAIKPMMRRKQGAFINLSSVVGVQGNAGQTNYSASKAGIIGFTKSLARELGSRNIRANVIAPGFIKTEMTDKLNEEQLKAFTENVPLGRPGEAEDVAQTAVFLASGMSAYINGQVISVCGGMMM